jgi:hypothetical protein
MYTCVGAEKKPLLQFRQCSIMQPYGELLLRTGTTTARD